MSEEPKPEETAPVENELDDDTGETILHHLAKEGCIEALTKILDLEETPKINQSKLVEWQVLIQGQNFLKAIQLCALRY